MTRSSDGFYLLSSGGYLSNDNFPLRQSALGAFCLTGIELVMTYSFNLAKIPVSTQWSSVLYAARMRRFPPPWTVEKIPGGLKVVDADGQSLAYVYSRDHPHGVHVAGLLTEDEARQIAANIAKLPDLLGKGNA